MKPSKRLILCYALCGTVFALSTMISHSVQAQTFTVLHSFTGGGDGGQPEAGLTMDAAGNLYGTTLSGGGTSCNGGGCGTVFKLKHSGSNWVLNPLYSFNGVSDGLAPQGRVTIARDGTLYGTTSQGPRGDCGGWGCGTVFRLRPSLSAPHSALAPWSETVVFAFDNGVGSLPQGDLVFDQSGNIYGTASYGAQYTCGAIYELTPSGGGWTETVLYQPRGNGGDGCGPEGGIVFDTSGNLYGVYYQGGQNNWGAVYQLRPSGPPWTQEILYSFNESSTGAAPIGGLIMDNLGNLYGSNTYGGLDGGGIVFEVQPGNGGWSFNPLYYFTGHVGIGPEDKLVMDASGNLYGTTYYEGAYSMGSVFKLTPSDGAWTYTSLHDFTGGNDGKYPISSLVFDTNGNLYGTASAGGIGNCPYGGCGVVFEIAP